jgi:hypothetical protein
LNLPVLVDLHALASDPGMWRSVVAATVVMAVSSAIGLAAGRRVEAIALRTWRPESFAFALGLGVLLLVSGYAAVRSGGASNLTPVFGLLVAAVALGRGKIAPTRPKPSWIALLATGAAAMSALVLLYGVTTSPSPRAGLQPIEFMDEAYYAVLGAQLHETGLESVYEPAGFGRLVGTPERTWYHWGESWLAAIALRLPGMTPMHALHHVALPVLVLATCLLAGAITSRLAARAHRKESYLLAGFGMLSLAPVPLVIGDHFDWWARPVGFTVTQYGLAFVVALLGMYLAITWPARAGLPRFVLIAAIAGALVASHILVAATSAVGLLVAGLAALVIPGTERRPMLRGFAAPAIAATVGVVVVIGWGWIAGFGVGGSSAVQGVKPFDLAWQRAVVLVSLGGVGLVVGIVIALRLRGGSPRLRPLALGALAAVVAGGLVWGIRLPDFNAFHAFYGPISVLLTPIAVAGLVLGVISLRSAGRRRAATTLLVVLLMQGAIGISTTVQRLYEFGPGHYDPVPVAALDFIRTMPPQAKLAYACAQVEEVAPWDARLISITAHTGRKVVPLCYQADVFGVQLGQTPDLTVPGPFFILAPQRALWPSHLAKPSAAEVANFMRTHHIDFILADTKHANTLLPDATPIYSERGITIYRRP